MGSLLVCCGLMGAGAGYAHAEPGDAPRRDDNRPQAVQQTGAQRQAEPRQADPRQVDPRSSFEARAEEQRRAMQEARSHAEITRRVGRLTPDERRDLRRQINEVGQDIYANPPRR